MPSDPDIPAVLNHKYEIGTSTLPAYILLYRNARTSNKWYVHRGYNFAKEVQDTAQTFKNVGFDVMVLFLDKAYADKETQLLNAF